MIAVAGGLGLLWETKQPPAPTAPAVVADAIPAPAPATPTRTEAEILNEDVNILTAAWFAPNPDILVLDFPSLTAQGQAFNRMAAFIEKRGLSRDHVPDDKELADAIREDGSTVETYYYGHDYRAADIRRFYTTVDRQGLKLSEPELALRTLLTREGFLVADANKAVISIPRKGSDPFVDASGRQSLLRHELSHGEYFTDPVFAAYVQKFWSSTMTEADRDSFRGFLDRQGYDPTNEDLMANETQAHLMNTTDRRYFNAGACGLPIARLAELRALFLAGMPQDWLRDAMTAMTPRLPS
ncbi:MAG TPA: hypothetical protein VFG62_26235 [Rhodopila sp.]|nr:hypothetical protein [Rhodopila sp.]